MNRPSPGVAQPSLTPEADWRRTGGFMRYMDRLANLGVWESKLSLLVAVIIAAGPCWLIITTPVGLAWQALFAIGSFALCSWLRRYEGHLISITMMMISLLTSFRYFYWRVTETIGVGAPGVTYVDLFFAIGLILAEFYAVLVLILGYFQVLWPLHRRPYPLPEDTDLWPTVDVFVPTYNEPMEVVRPTVLAALQIDWPEDKIKVYVLDDGCRDEFGEFCEQVGAVHLPRKESTHAKAGNINKAMTKTSGELVTIFDCDHIPTRSFLQVAVGWFLKDPKMALVQLPHHFFSPDPFERNLGTFKQVPNEGELFYGLLQDGNDFWDATFFCGSCAVLRREALEEVGGVAVETVTEDAHTALKMHRRGWRSAYINVAQAAGLATESLSAHIGQRIRWARGMAQIFRVDNPLFKRGLRLGQRLCYANAMLHFFYGLPRIVFLSAPLSYLLFDAKIIQAQALMIAAYAIPHLLIANMTNSRLQGPFRHSFWAEVYETVLASYITAPTLLAIINPKLGSFNVTAKGGIVENEYFDQKMAVPYLILVAANMGGVIIGFGRLFFWSTHEIDTVILNMTWSIYNLIIIGAALAVAWESKQVRRTIRVESDLEAEVRLPDGTVLSARTLDISEGGCAVRVERALQLERGSDVSVRVLPAKTDVEWQCTVTRSAGDTLSVQFTTLDIEQEKHLLHCIFGRADAWVTWANKRDVDHPGRAFVEVLSFGYYGVYRVIEMYLGRSVTGMRKWLSKLLRRATVAASLLVALGALAALHPVTADAQQSASRGKPLPQVTRTLTLEELSGIQDSIRLRGIQGEISLPVSVRDDEVITRAEMTLRYAHSPSLVFELSHINVFVNTELVTTIPLSEQTASGGEYSFEIDPRLFVRYNTILLQFIGHYTYECEDPAHTTLWANISKTSSLELTTQPLRLANELNLLPQPFFDRRDQSTLELPFVFSGEPSIEQMKAAGIVASWFGAQASYRGARFPVVTNGDLPEGHAVVIGTAGSRVGSLNIPSEGASSVSIVENPAHDTSKLLVISGASGEGLITAAKALSLGAEALAGSSAVIRDLQEPAPRDPYDAPRWVPTDRAVEFGELVSSRQLEVRGLYPDLIRVNFHVPPDLYAWESKGVPLDLKYRYTPTIGPKSTLNVNINNEFVEAIPLSNKGESGSAQSEIKRRIQIPFLSELDSVNNTKIHIPYFKVTGSNQLQFHYYFERQKLGECKDTVLDNLRGVIDPASTIDFSKFPHYTALPELSLFANGGFPYSRLADMSATAVVLPNSLSDDEITTYLSLMGHLGNSTGYPATRVSLVQGADVSQLKGKHVIVLGGAGNQPLLETWADEMPLSLVGGTARLRVIGPFERLLGRWRGYDLSAAIDHAGQVLLEAGDALGAMMSFESPVSGGKAVVVLTAGNSERLRHVADLLLDAGDRQFLQGDLVLLNGSEINHYRLGHQFKIGRLPFFMALKHWFSTKPLGLLLLMLVIALIVAAALYRALRRMAIARHEGKR